MSEQKVLAKLKEIQVLRWQLAIERLHHASTQTKSCEKSAQIVNLEVALAQTRLAQKKLEYSAYVSKEKLAEKNWHKVRDQLAEETKLKLENVGLNEDTYELIELEPQPSQGVT